MKRWFYMIIFFLNGLSIGLLLPIMSLIFTGKGGTVKELSIGFSILSLTVIILEIPSGLFADLFGRRDCFCLSLFFKSAGYFLLLSLHSRSCMRVLPFLELERHSEAGVLKHFLLTGISVNMEKKSFIRQQ